MTSAVLAPASPCFLVALARPGRALPAGPAAHAAVPPFAGRRLARVASTSPPSTSPRGRLGQVPRAASARRSGRRRSADAPRTAPTRDVPAAASPLRGGQHRRHDRRLRTSACSSSCRDWIARRYEPWWSSSASTRSGAGSSGPRRPASCSKPSPFALRRARLRRAGWPGPLLLPLAVVQSGLNALLFLVTAARYAGVLRREARRPAAPEQLDHPHPRLDARRAARGHPLRRARAGHQRPVPVPDPPARAAAGGDPLHLARPPHDNLLAHGFGPGNLHTIPNGLDPAEVAPARPARGRPRRARPGAGPPGDRRRRQHPPVEGPGGPDPRAAGDPGARARRRLRASSAWRPPATPPTWPASRR